MEKTSSTQLYEALVIFGFWFKSIKILLILLERDADSLFERTSCFYLYKKSASKRVVIRSRNLSKNVLENVFEKLENKLFVYVTHYGNLPQS